MTSLETCIREAVEKGWKNPDGWATTSSGVLLQWDKRAPGKDGEQGWLIFDREETWLYEQIFLDPLFWQSLGRARGWEERKFFPYDSIHSTGEYLSEAQWYSRCFWNHIWKGKDAESFFAAL